MLVAIGLSPSSISSNLFNGKADVPNCYALASADSPSLIYVRLIECLFCSAFLPSALSVSLSLFGLANTTQHTLPCPSPLRLFLSPDQCIKSAVSSPQFLLVFQFQLQLFTLAIEALLTRSNTTQHKNKHSNSHLQQPSPDDSKICTRKLKPPT
jgi:hypothetical protein